MGPAPGGSAEEPCNPSGKLGSPFPTCYHRILWRAVQLALVVPRGNITFSFNSLSINWYCSVCPQVICVVFLNLHLSWGSRRHYKKCIAAIIWPVIAICVSITVYSQKNDFPACCECLTNSKMWNFLLSLLRSSAIPPGHGHYIEK